MFILFCVILFNILIVVIFTPSKSRKDWKYEIRPYSVSGGNNLTKEEINKKTFRFKRLPKHWIPEFDKL
jgi:hypothetical protein